MLRPPPKLMYAIEAVLDIAYNAVGEPVQSSDITRRQGISRRYLEPVLQQLVRAGLLVGVRGPKGGYRLARERRRISLGDITRVVLDLTEDPFGDENGGDGNGREATRSGGSALGREVVRPLWRDLEDEMLERLDAITIEELCLRARRAGLEGDRFRDLDFSI